MNRGVKGNINAAVCVFCKVNIEIKHLIKLYNSFRYIIDIFEFSML